VSTLLTTAPAITSEVAPLRRVLVHRPGAELSRLSPDNMAALVFDAIPWPGRAREEHDAFCRLLASRGGGSRCMSCPLNRDVG
jgi:arginine deiminase